MNDNGFPLRLPPKLKSLKTKLLPYSAKIIAMEEAKELNKSTAMAEGAMSRREDQKIAGISLSNTRI